jgi:protoheme IX farnesyltransferase
MLVQKHPERLPLNMMLHTVLMVPLGAVFAYGGVTDWSFALTSLVPTLWFVRDVAAFSAKTNQKNARKVFLGSVKFLPLYLILLLVHHLYQRHKDGSIAKAASPSPPGICD